MYYRGSSISIGGFFMKRYLLFLKNHISKLILCIVIPFLCFFLGVEIYNKANSYYTATFSVENIEKFEDAKLVDVNLLNEVKASGANGKYENINVEKMIKKGHFSYTVTENSITITTKYKYYDEFFLSSSNSLSTRAKMFVKDTVLKVAGENKITFSNSKDIVELHNYQNKWAIAGIGTGTFFILTIVASIIIFFKVKDKEVAIEDEYDNVTLFKTCFHKEYWKQAINPFHKVKDITLVAMLFALMMVSKLIPIPSGFGNLGLSFTYLFFATVAMIYGPIYGFIIGVFSDIIGFFINSTGMFNLGYTLQAALTGFIYGICLYRRKVTFGRVLVSRILVNYLMNVLLGSILFVFVFYYTPGEMSNAEFFEKVKYYILLLSLPKNTIYLLPQSLLLFAVLKVITPVLARYRIIDKKMIVRSKKA